MAETMNKQDDIKIISSSVDAVRKLPDVYIGALGNSGFMNMYREIIQNSLDEIMKGNTIDKNVIVSFDERTHTVIVEDNGQGIVLDKLVDVFTILHSSSNYDKKAGSGKYSSGKNGMGATITNFLSKYFIVESYRMDGTAAKVEFSEGKLTSKGLQNMKCSNGKHGLITTFEPSAMMGQITSTVEDVYTLTWMLTNLCKIGTTVTFNAIELNGRKSTKKIVNSHGIQEILGANCKKPVSDPIYYVFDNGTMKIELLFTYDLNEIESTEAKIISFNNTCPTSGGTHVDGFLNGLIKYMRDYMNKVYLVNNKKLNVNATDIRTGLVAIVNTCHLSPFYTGQAKNILSSEDMLPFATEQTLACMDQWAQNSPADLQKISKYLKEVCEIRTKIDGEKIKMSDKYSSSVISGYPAKYKKPNSNKHFELWITEGDSACSCMENNRDKESEGLYPIKGKLINAFTTPIKKYFENEEVCSIFKICGYNGYSKVFDPDKFKPEKVVIATDADADGKHIECLIFGLFLRYMPFVIEQGKLYVANAPLYGIELSKNNYKFFSDNIDYIEYVQTTFCKENVIQDARKKPLTKKEITNVLYKNIDYASIVDHISGLYSIDPYLLEFILMNRNLEFKKFKSTVEKVYKFVNVENVNGTIMIRGLVGSNYQTIFFGQRLLNDCADLIELIDKNEEYYIINGKNTSIYGLMTLFRSFAPKNMTRYKGLGEMKPNLLGISTVIPGYGRTLKQYTIDDAKHLLKKITALQTDKSAFVKGIKIRKEDIV